MATKFDDAFWLERYCIAHDAKLACGGVSVTSRVLEQPGDGLVRCLARGALTVEDVERPVPGRGARWYRPERRFDSGDA